MLKLSGLFILIFFVTHLFAGGTLQKGDSAPNFELKDYKGKLHKLSDYKGKIVALYFYPKDGTRGCTEEACNLRDNFSILTKKNIVVLGVSYDDSVSHQKFIEEYELPFPLLSDTEKIVAKAYGAFREGYSTPSRITIIIAENGKIMHTITDVSTANHSSQILAVVNKKDKVPQPPRLLQD